MSSYIPTKINYLCFSTDSYFSPISKQQFRMGIPPRQTTQQNKKTNSFGSFFREVEVGEVLSVKLNALGSRRLKAES